MDPKIKPAPAAVNQNPQTITVPIAKVRPWKDNPRQVKKSDYKRLIEQIRRLGFYKALLATEDLETPGNYIVLGGNTRLKALAELGWTEIGLTLVDAPTDDLRLQYNLSDNDNVGAWDDQALAEIAFRTKDRIQNLDIFKIDLSRPVSIPRLLDAFGPSAITQDPEDQVPPAETEPETQPGDLFTLGDHRLLCADANNPKAFDLVLDGKKADMVFTDPPTSMTRQGEDLFLAFSEQLWANLSSSMRPGGCFYVFAGFSELPAFLYSLKKNGLVLDGLVVWTHKAAWGGSDYGHQHQVAARGKAGKPAADPILYGWAPGKHYFWGQRLEADVWDIPSSSGRPGQKPLSLVQRAIRNSSKPGDLILDPFAGLGASLIAASREARKAALIEIDQARCDYIIRRWAAQGMATEAEIRNSVIRPPKIGDFGPSKGRTPRGRGKVKAHG